LDEAREAGYERSYSSSFGLNEELFFLDMDWAIGLSKEGQWYHVGGR